ncbi:MAG: serine hydrolase [Caldilineaceae bacterium]|nr:serine hydrolase [Caldilineaceae bacterium]
MGKFTRFVLILIAVLAVFPVYTRYKVIAAPIAPGVTLGGLALDTLKDRDEIARHLEGVYAAPVTLYFGDQRLVLEPAAVDFAVDVDQMLNEASAFLEGPDFLDIAVRAALGMDQRTRNVPVRFVMNSDKLQAWLEEAAALHNSEPQGQRLLPPAARRQEAGAADADAPAAFVGETRRGWYWTDGAPGYTLDVAASLPLVIDALTSHTERSAVLTMDVAPAPRPAMADLAAALDSYSSSFPGFAAAYVHEFDQATSAAMDADVAFSGMSTLKIAIVTAAMEKLGGMEADDPTATEVGQWIDLALGESNNYAANLVLSWLGDGNSAAGAQRVTQVMRALGLESTYMQSGYDFATQLPQIPTPGNQQEEWDTNPDSNLQSTPREMGELLAAIYDCTQDQGLLRTTFPATITPDECEYILFYMSHDEFKELLWSGLPRPEDAWIVHKHGFAFESHSDAALIWGPDGPYVVSVFLYRPGWMDWETSNGAMRDISRITWNFFERRRTFDEAAGAEDGGEAEPPVLSPPPVYVPVGAYAPAG